MSDPGSTIGSAPETSSTRRTHETVGGVLGLALGCLLVVWGLLLPFGKPAAAVIPDGEALLREHFDVRELPFGAHVVRAERRLDGTQYVTLRSASAPPTDVVETAEDVAPKGVSDEDVPSVDGGGPDTSGNEKGQYDKTDWGAVPVGPHAEPLEVLFAHHPEDSAQSVIQRNFRSLEYKDLENIGGDGETVPIDAGEMAWGPYDVRWVHLRAFHKDDDRATFYDLLRVNLTLDRTCWIVHLRWADRVPGTLADARIVLDAIRPMLVESSVEPATN